VTCTHAPGRVFPHPVVRQMLRALGVVTCDRCGQALGILGRREDNYRAVAEKPDDRIRF